MKKISILIFISFFVYGCSDSSPDDLVQEDFTTPNISTFDDNIRPIMSSSCVECHAGSTASAGLRLETFAQVRASTEFGNLIDRITREIGDPLLMPRGGPRLPNSSIDLILQWERDGFPEN